MRDFSLSFKDKAPGAAGEAVEIVGGKIVTLGVSALAKGAIKIERVRTVHRLIKLL